MARPAFAAVIAWHGACSTSTLPTRDRIARGLIWLGLIYYADRRILRAFPGLRGSSAPSAWLDFLAFHQAFDTSDRLPVYADSCRHIAGPVLLHRLCAYGGAA